jgi:hypothetical protein
MVTTKKKDIEDNMYGIYDNNKLLAKFATPLSLISNRPVLMTDALSLKRNISKRAAHRWEISSNLEPLSYNANELFALFVRKGNFGQIDVRVPQNFGVIAARAATATVLTATGASGATAVSIAAASKDLTTLTASQLAEIIPIGSMIRFASHSKVYMTSDTLKNNGTLSVYPELRAGVSSAVMYHRDDVDMPCLADTDSVTGMAYTDGVLMDLGTVKLIERLV